MIESNAALRGSKNKWNENNTRRRDIGKWKGQGNRIRGGIEHVRSVSIY